MAAKSTFTLYANPYSGDAGFYFTALDEFEEGMAALARRGIEEVEIEVIDGEQWEVDLANACDVSQVTVIDLFYVLDKIHGDKSLAAAAFWALKHGGADISELVWAREIERIRDDKGIRCGMDTEEYAEELLADGIIGESTYETYFDWDRFGADIRSDVEESAVEAARDSADSDEEADAEEERVRAEYDRMDDTEVAEEYVDLCGGLAECLPRAGSGRRGQRGPTLEDYFDLEKFARDLDLNGEVNEFEFAGQTCIATNPNG